MDLRSSKPESTTTCPKCGYKDLSEKAHFCPECGAAILTAPKPPPAQIEVTQDVGRVEGGQVVGVDIGQVLGDVNIGNYTLRIGSIHGGVVNVASPQQQRLPQPRTLPVFLLPRPSPGLLDRKSEIATATTTLQSISPVEFHGPAGIGKTKLLHYLVHDQLTSVFSDGVVYFSAIHHKPVDDLLLDLFDAFYEREATYKPTPTQVRHDLQNERALVVLDDVDLGRDDVAALMDAAPSCTFLLSSTECCLWGEGRALALQGLPPDDALALVERELGRPLTAEERSAVPALCAALGGHPLRLLQLVALVRDDGYTLTDLAARLPGDSPAEALREQALAACSEQERRILAVLAAARGASVGDQHLGALAGITDVAPALDSLQQRKLVEAHIPRYSLTGSLDEALREEWDLSQWNEQTLEHFAEWAEQHRQDPERVAEEADAILGIVQWAQQEGRWEGALRLGQVVEGALALSGQWGAWAQVLGLELQAARELGYRTAEAWSLHQSGTRALCLEDPSTAHMNLMQALQLRESLGDEEGAAVTRHNLELLGGLGGDHGPEDDGGGNGGGGEAWIPMLVIGAMALLIGVVFSCSIWNSCLATASEVRPFLPPAIKEIVTLLPSIFSSDQTIVGSDQENEGDSQNKTPKRDTALPKLKLPDDITKEATSKNGAKVDYEASANDAVDGDIAVSCAPLSGSTFPIGTTKVDCSAKDTVGNEAKGSFKVTVKDTTAPTISGIPPDITEEATSKDGAKVTYTSPTARDAVDGDITVRCDPASNSIFSLGEKPVNCSATDKANNKAKGSFKVVVSDTTPPKLSLPRDITRSTTDYYVPLVVTYAVSAIDIVDGPVPVNCAPPPQDSAFPIGTTNVICSATDTAGNSVTDSFNVTVDYSPPPPPPPQCATGGSSCQYIK